MRQLDPLDPSTMTYSDLRPSTQRMLEEAAERAARPYRYGSWVITALILLLIFASNWVPA